MVLYYDPEIANQVLQQSAQTRETGSYQLDSRLDRGQEKDDLLAGLGTRLKEAVEEHEQADQQEAVGQETNKAYALQRTAGQEDSINNGFSDSLNNALKAAREIFNQAHFQAVAYTSGARDYDELQTPTARAMAANMQGQEQGGKKSVMEI